MRCASGLVAIYALSVGLEGWFVTQAFGKLIAEMGLAK